MMQNYHYKHLSYSTLSSYTHWYPPSTIPGKHYSVFHLCDFVIQNGMEMESYSMGPFEIGLIHSDYHL